MDIFSENKNSIKQIIELKQNEKNKEEEAINPIFSELEFLKLAINFVTDVFNPNVENIAADNMVLLIIENSP